MNEFLKHYDATCAIYYLCTLCSLWTLICKMHNVEQKRYNFLFIWLQSTKTVL